MTDALAKAIDIAKKLRRAAKKIADPAFHSLVTDLTLSLADLKVQMVEQRAAEHDQTQQTATTSPAPQGIGSSPPPVPEPTSWTLR